MNVDVPVITGPHSNIVNNWLKAYQKRAIWLNQLVADHRSKIWKVRNERTSDVFDLIPGIPDDLVEMEIWPRLRKHFEEAPPRDDPWDPDTLDTTTTIQRIDDMLALFHTSRKWRHLVQFSKPWAALRILRYHRPFGDKLIVDHLNKILFERNLRVLPPIDMFAVEKQVALLYWFNSWHDFDEEDRNVCLALYGENPDHVWRLDNWVRQRT